MFFVYFCLKISLMLNKNYSLLIILLLSFSFCQYITAQESINKKDFYSAIIGFYNVENLYDTIDSPDTDDSEFLPNGKNEWTGERYYQKMGQLSRVISEMGTEINPDGLAILGLCELENKDVVTDLIATQKLKGRKYEIVHYNSPDRRGIDVGFIYQPKYFKVTASKTYSVHLEGKPDFRTRDQLLVSGKLDGEQIHVIVAHWPSRRGGEKKSMPNRVAAATVGRHIIDSLFALDPNAKIIYMGDLNDDPINNSVKNVLKSGSNEADTVGTTLFNPMHDLHKKGIGSLAYRDAWNLFDQTILSPNWMKKDYSSFCYYGAKVYNKPYLASPEGQYKGYPFRTYSGGAFTGGFSDHFPVYVVLVKEKK